MLPNSLQQLLGKHFLRWQEQAQKMAERLQTMRLEGQAGGGQVRAIVTGTGELLEIHIDPQLLMPENHDLLEDLIVVAVRDAVRQAEETQRQQFQEMLGQLPLGGLFGLGR